MAIKITDRVLVYAMFVVMAVLSASVIVGNRDAENAAKAAVISANQARDAAQVVATNLANSPPCK